MASSAPLADIEERFFWCSVCHEPFNDPKQLPCLHRYCRHCLEGVIAGFKDSFRCPLCQQKHKIPKEGVDGYKTDFHIKSVVEFLQLQASYEEDNVKICHGCEEAKKVVAYCFKCKNFLCDQCYGFHLNNNMVVEHRPHTLNLKNADMKSLTLDKLSCLTEDPRCITHAKHLAQLCCETCGNLPICVACTYGSHKGHVIHDVKILASAEREKLKAILEELDGYKDRLYDLPKRVNKARQQLKDDVDKKIEKAEREHKQASETISKRMEENKAALEQRKHDIQRRKEEDCNQVEQERDRGVEEVRQKYDRILNDKLNQYDTKTAQVEGKHGKIDGELSAKHNEINGELESFKEKVHANRTQNQQELQGIGDHSEHTISRFENYKGTSSTVLASKDEWTDARCMPDITAASGPLIRDVKREFNELDSLTNIGITDLSFEPIPITEHEGPVLIAESEESVVDIRGLKDNGCRVTDITTNWEGHIIITGYVNTQYSYITHVTKEGEIIRQDQIGRAGTTLWRYCGSLSQSLVATACYTGQVGIYDINSAKYVEKDIKDEDPQIKWPDYICGVTTDYKNNTYVGGDRKSGVLVFDDKLNHLHTLILPEMIEYACAMTVHEGHLVICDRYGNGNAYAVTMGDQEAKLVHQFPKPDFDCRGWRSSSVCADSDGYVYMLWESGKNRILAQYSQDSHQLLSSRKVDDDAECITTLESGFGEELLLATCNTGKLYVIPL